jgi:hypothetical protein
VDADVGLPARVQRAADLLGAWLASSDGTKAADSAAPMPGRSGPA